MDNFDKQVDRNLLGIRCEKEGKVDDAIILYEKNISEEFVGNHPYDRLAIIYHKQNLFNEEIRVLEKGIDVFTGLVGSPRTDVIPKLNKFKSRLEKIKKKIE